jgi:hypothetical protein
VTDLFGCIRKRLQNEVHIATVPAAVNIVRNHNLVVDRHQRSHHHPQRSFEHAVAGSEYFRCRRVFRVRAVHPVTLRVPKRSQAVQNVRHHFVLVHCGVVHGRLWMRGLF